MDKKYNIILGIIVTCNILLLLLMLNINSKAAKILKQAERNGGNLVDVKDKLENISGKLWLKYWFIKCANT